MISDAFKFWVVLACFGSGVKSWECFDIIILFLAWVFNLSGDFQTDCSVFLLKSLFLTFVLSRLMRVRV